MANTVEKEHWHLDKKLPLGLLIAIVIQTATFVYFGTSWKASIDNRLDNLDEFRTTISASRPTTLNRITILEENTKFIKETLSRIEGKLDKAPGK